eukprot:CAMPEP_0195523984 /NCGR_PEP_ID=MMETSP0794_2-20130614/23532_1 /TAXON_ID=515487 /ORGANISM="Stephanopyxis turris, Strain CCMP 815" /LENGTH=297 /DNA_ID=CAMNT_0040654105 /DNA_START=435 /DNA_END=1328 /DNA_ORIENTATION=+
MTPGYDQNAVSKSPWLEFGTWHRVPHMQSQISNYDWILYADVDWIVHDMSRPLEAFFKYFDFHGKHNVSIILPTETSFLTFSAYVVMIRNNEFGRRILHNWNDFAHGLCANGNYAKWKTGQTYDWEWSDQPGIWYSLWRTHEELIEGRNVSDNFCNKTDGLITDRRRVGGPKLNEYFGANDIYLRGSEASTLSKMPKDQAIVWTSYTDKYRPHLGQQLTFGGHKAREIEFAVHIKENHEKWPGNMQLEYNICRNLHGCFANYTLHGELVIGCNNHNYLVPTNRSYEGASHQTKDVLG